MTSNESIAEVLHKRLTANCLWPNEADDVLELVRARKDDLSRVLDDTAAGYPPQFMPVAWLSVMAMAVEYIDENCPQHFARGMFVPGGEATTSAPKS